MKSTHKKNRHTSPILKLLCFSTLFGATIATSFSAAAEMTMKQSPVQSAAEFTVVGQPGTAPDTAPMAVAMTEVRYPYRSDGRAQEGWVIVKLDIDEEGVPYNTAVVRSDGGSVFHRYSLSALKRFRFAPATLDGEPVAVTGKRYKISFNYTDG